MSATAVTPTLLHGDCLELMKTLPDKSVDCFICDLPYGILMTGGIQTNDELKKKYNVKDSHSLGGCEWDVKLDLTQFWTQVKRLCKNDHTPVLMFCNTKFGYELIKSNESWFRYDLVWDKERGVSFLTCNKMPMKSHEMVYVFAKTGAYYKRIDEADETKKEIKGFVQKQTTKTIRAGSGLLKANSRKAGFRVPLSVIRIKKPVGRKAGGHPTEKPIDLYKWLLERYCPENGTVLDPTAGSFNSILAAQELKLKGIGIEKDDAFYAAACKKFVATAPQTAPHTPAPPAPLRNEVVLTPAVD